MKGQLRIEQMFAFIVVDDDNTEGIPALNLSGLQYPMIGANMKRVEQLMPHAKIIAREMKKKITLVKFTNREEIEEILP